MKTNIEWADISWNPTRVREWPDGWTLRRDCLTCGVEHWVQKREGVLPMSHEYRSSGKVLHSGQHAPRCVDHRRCEPAIEVSIVGKRWVVRERPRDGIFAVVMQETTDTYDDAIDHATRWTRAALTRGKA